MTPRTLATHTALALAAAFLCAGTALPSTLDARYPAGTILAMPADENGEAPVSDSVIVLMPRRAGPQSAIPRPRPDRLSSVIYSTNDSLKLFLHSLDGPDGSCLPNGWVGQDLTTGVYAHVSPRFLVNGQPLLGGGTINMGTRGMWFGADSSTAPELVKGWLLGTGYGAYWSHRLASPQFSRASHPNAILTFDVNLGLGATSALAAATAGTNHGFAVQGLRADGRWVVLTMRYVTPTATATATGLRNTGQFRGTVSLGADGNDALGLGADTQLRFVAQSGSTLGAESGVTLLLGAVVDNITLRDGATDVLPPVDFEDESTGGWTLSALHGRASRPGSTAPIFTRDIAPPNTVPQPRSGIDPNDPTCVWSFLSPGDTLANGTCFRLVSPYVRYHTDDGSGPVLLYTTKFPITNSRTFITYRARWKNAGGTRPAFIRSSPFQLFGSGTSDADAALVQDWMSHLDLSSAAPPTAPLTADSVQFVFEVFDISERYLTDSTFSQTPPSRIPFFDDLSIVFVGADQDYDGVPDDEDGCPTVQAAGQDADGDGCPDSTRTMRHVEYWPAAMPLTYAISQAGDPAITDGSDLTAIEEGFATWAAVPGASLSLAELPPTTRTESSPLDGVNLVTFEDNHIEFPPSVIAVTPTLSFTRRGSYLDRVAFPGQIVDADMVFNRSLEYSTATHDGGPGSVNLKSVVVHEAGHFLGLSHSGVLDACMFFVLQAGAQGEALTDDDRAAVAAAYPAASLALDYGTIRGKVTRGGTAAPIAGALVTAVRLDGGGAPMDSSASDYTAEDGTYALRRLAPGQYSVRLTPLDGNVGGFPLTAAYINARVESSAASDFSGEWWNTGDGPADDPAARDALAVVGGGILSNVDLVTDIDITPPLVSQVSPAGGATSVRIDNAVVVEFSEAVNASTLQSAFSFHVAGAGNPKLGGGGQLLNAGRSFVFSPAVALSFGTTYQIDVSAALTDVQGNPLAAPFSSTFQTETRPSVAITAVQPREASVGSLVEIVGVGFGTAEGDVNTVLFPSCAACAPIPVTPSIVGASSMVAQVPAGAESGSLQVTSNGETSNALTFTLLPPLAQVAPSLTGEFALPEGFAPSDVAIAPDNLTLYAVGRGGFATVNLESSRPDFRVPRIAALGELRHVVLSPDGFTAYATLPGTGEVLAVDADPLSGTFRQVRAAVSTGEGGAPDGIALSSNGRRAYVTDAYAGVVYELDTDASSPTLNRVLREIHDPDAALTDGIAVAPGSSKLYFTSADAGGRRLALGDPLATADAVHEQACAGAAAVTPSGIELLLAEGGAGGTSLLWSRLEGPTPVTGAVALGGQVRDVATSPRSPSAFVVNAAFNKLQVVDVNPASANYHRKVAEAATGSHPVAVGVSADGALILVANEASNSLSLYGTGSTGQVTRITPAFAAPGDRVAVQFTPGFDATGVQFDLGEGAFAASRVASPAAVAAALEVPQGFQRQAGLTAIDAGGARTLALPFRVVDRIEGLDPRPTGIVAGPAAAPCGPGSSVGRMTITRGSHDGRLLAVVRERDCDVLLDLYRAADAAPSAFGGLLATITLGAVPGTPRGLEFTPDDRRLWATLGADAILEVDADPSSPTFGQVSSFATAAGETPGALCADPMGRSMLVAQDGGILGLWDPATRLRSASVALPAPSGCVATTPDGRYAVAGHDGRATLVDLDAVAVVTTTPSHAGAPSNAVRSIAVTRDGRQAVGSFEQGRVAVWNLDPALGAIGAERYYGVVIAGPAARPLVPAPDGDGVLAGCDDCSNLYKLEPSVVPPAVSAAGLGQPSRSLAASPDGRLLWVANWDATGATGDVRAFTLSEATSLALQSGGNQVGVAGSALPVAVRVRLTDDAASPEAGLPVRFRLPSGDGSLDGLGASVLRLTDANGEASVSWTLRSTAGSDLLEAEALGVPGATLQVGATATGDDNLVLPAVAEFGPANGATNVNVGTSFFVRFNQRVIAASVDTTVRLYNGPTRWQLGKVSLTADGRGVILSAPQPLPFSTECRLVVRAGVVDAEGQKSLVADSTIFTTQAAPPLALTGLSPPSTKAGSPILLTGEGFSPIAAQNTVVIGGVIVTPQPGGTAQSLEVNVPLSLAYGQHPVTVTTGGVTSNALTYTVPLPPPAGFQIGDYQAQPGVSRIAISQDGQTAYVTNPELNTVTVMRISPPGLIANISAGFQPSGITILPDGKRAYVANSGAGTLSMLDIDPASPTRNRVVETVDVGGHPVDVAVSGVGPTLVVLDGDSIGTMSFVDARPGNGTYNRVVSSTSTGSGGRGLVISPDGTRGFVVSAGGQLIEIDVRSRQVVSSTSIGSGGKSVVISPDGTVLFVLTAGGQLLAIDVAPDSPTRNRVIASTSVGSTGKSVVVSPDGTVAFASNGSIVQVFAIVESDPGSASTYNPGQRLTLVPLREHRVAQAPAGIALDPAGRFQLVVDEGTGRIVLLGAPDNVVTPTRTDASCITASTPCVTVPFTIARSDTSQVRAFSVTFQLSPNLAVCGGAAGIVEGTYLSGLPGAQTNLQRVQNPDGSWTVDGVVLGPLCGPADPGGTLFTVSVGAAGADGSGTVSVTNFRLRDCANDSLPASLGPVATLTVDRAAPVAIAALAAAQEKSGNDGSGRTAITVTWPAVEAGATVEVYRTGFGHYPEYDDAGGAAPAVPAYPPPSPAWELVGTVSSGTALTDVPDTRDAWHYAAFVKDGCGNRSPVSNLTPGTLDYFLGDFSNGVAAGDGDNRVGSADVSLLGAHYGAVLAPGDPLAFLDVGPTSDFSPNGRPLTDNQVEFEDLVMIALNYGLVSAPQAAARPLVAARLEDVRIVAPDRVEAGGTFDVALLAQGAEGLQALSMQLGWDRNVAEPLSAEAGALLASAGGLVLSSRPGNVDAALLGAGAGLTGEGTLATVRFRALAAGEPRVSLASVEARDTRNQKVLPERVAVPTVTMLSRPLPNPASGASAMSFSLARGGAVELAVFGVDGRRVKTLVRGELKPGFYDAAWNGTDAGGRPVGPGVFFVRLVAPGARMAHKLVWLR